MPKVVIVAKGNNNGVKKGHNHGNRHLHLRVLESPLVITQH